MDSETQRGRGKSPGKLIGCKIVLLGFSLFVVHVFSCKILSSIDILVGGGSLHRKNRIAIVTFDGMGKGGQTKKKKKKLFNSHLAAKYLKILWWKK